MCIYNNHEECDNCNVCGTQERVCSWCGKACDGEFCSPKCETTCWDTYVKDMESGMDKCHVGLMEAHGEVPMDMCPVCDVRPKDKDMATCLATSCREEWDIAWSE